MSGIIINKLGHFVALLYTCVSLKQRNLDSVCCLLSVFVKDSVSCVVIGTARLQSSIFSLKSDYNFNPLSKHCRDSTSQLSL